MQPELHAVLASIGSAASRGERLRQLAALGLVWETLRLQGRREAQATAPTPRVTVEDAEIEPADAPTSDVQPAAVVAAPSDDDEDFFVDLAIDVMSAPADDAIDPLPPGEATDRSAIMRSRPMPVLVDVVRPQIQPRPPAPAPARPDNELAARAATPGTTPSRLQRMKDKGLFKNG